MVTVVSVYDVPVTVAIGVVASPSNTGPRYTLYAVAPVLAVHESATCPLPATPARFVGLLGRAPVAADTVISSTRDRP